RASSPATRSASASIASGAPPASSTRRRSAASASRTVSVRRRRGMSRSAATPSSERSSASTEGSARSPAGAVDRRRLSSGGKLALHALPDAGDHLIGFAPYRLGTGALERFLGEPPHRFLGQARPELFEVPHREALPLERGNPVPRQLLNQPIAVEGQSSGALDQLGQTWRHR